MVKPVNLGSEVVIANGVEFNVWRELNTFITWGHMMTNDTIRYREANVISYRNSDYHLDYKNRKIIIDPKNGGDVPDSLVRILKQVADNAINQNNLIAGRTSH